VRQLRLAVATLFGFAAASQAGDWSPRLAIRIFSNMVCSCGETAATYSRNAIWLRRCVASWRLVTAISDQNFFKHFYTLSI
jgi:hypothetical protein